MVPSVDWALPLEDLLLLLKDPLGTLTPGNLLKALLHIHMKREFYINTWDIKRVGRYDGNSSPFRSPLREDKEPRRDDRYKTTTLENIGEKAKLLCSRGIESNKALFVAGGSTR